MVKKDYKVKSPERADQIKFPEPIGTVLLEDNMAIITADVDLANELIEDGFPLTEIKGKNAPKKKESKKGKGV